ncbi:MAG: elongation factor P [Candidatus Omnitrophica bacterium]|nr:elongation factor P [Candidatus Omnitrophota bacterium]
MIANELKNGTTIEVEGNLYAVTEADHIKPGKGPAYVRCKLKDLKRSKMIEKTFRSTEKVTVAILEETRADYLYHQEGKYYFMNDKDFEEIIVDETAIGEKRKFLKEASSATFLKHKGRLIDVVLPTFVDLKVIKSEPGVKGNTATAAKKKATLETSLVIEVPLFINNGDIVRVDTRTGKYVTRA